MRQIRLWCSWQMAQKSFLMQVMRVCGRESRHSQMQSLCSESAVKLGRHLTLKHFVAISLQRVGGISRHRKPAAGVGSHVGCRHPWWHTQVSMQGKQNQGHRIFSSQPSPPTERWPWPLSWTNSMKMGPVRRQLTLLLVLLWKSLPKGIPGWIWWPGLTESPAPPP